MAHSKRVGFLKFLEFVIIKGVLSTKMNYMIENNHSAKFAFLYMLSLAALIFLALSVGIIIFQIINKNIVDIVEDWRGRFDVNALRFAISAIIVAGPVFYLSAWQINKNLFLGRLDKDSGVRKWLTYFILLVASVVAIGYLIGLINVFLRGELVLKFGLKVITALAISGTVFSYYFYDIKREKVERVKNKMVKSYFYSSLVVVIAVLASGFFFVESPWEARRKQQDEKILSRFSQIDSTIFSYYDDNKVLPENLDGLLESEKFLSEKDLINPLTQKRFDYNLVSDRKYELCTDFQTSNLQDSDYEYGYIDKSRMHEAGYQCLTQKVEVRDKEVLGPVPVD